MSQSDDSPPPEDAEKEAELQFKVPGSLIEEDKVDPGVPQMPVYVNTNRPPDHVLFGEIPPPPPPPSRPVYVNTNRPPDPLPFLEVPPPSTGSTKSFLESLPESELSSLEELNPPRINTNFEQPPDFPRKKFKDKNPE